MLFKIFSRSHSFLGVDEGSVYSTLGCFCTLKIVLFKERRQREKEREKKRERKSVPTGEEKECAHGERQRDIA